MYCLPAVEQDDLQALLQKEPYTAEVLQQVERILASPAFERAQERARAFLRFIVAKTLLGRASEIKETTIAVSVWEEATNYNTAERTMVRVAAGDLRNRLDKYYAGAGRSDPIAVSIPLGSYVPNIVERRATVVVGEFIGWTPGLNHLCRVLSEEIAHQLAKSGVVRPSRSSNNGTKPPPGGYWLRGSLSCAKQKLHLNVCLINVANNEVVFDQPFEDGRDDLLRLARRVSQSVLTTLGPETGYSSNGHSVERFDRTRSTSEARWHLRRRTAVDIEKAIALFEQVIDAHPDYASAYAGLADCQLILSWYEISPPDRLWFEAAKRNAITAFGLNSRRPDVLTALGYAKLLCDFDWVGAEEDLRKAILLENRYPEAHHRLANLLTMTGRFQEAEQEIKRAFDLDPGSIVIRKTRGDPFYYSGRYEQAARCYQEALRFCPAFWMAHLFLGWCFEQLGDTDRALQEFETVTQTAGVSCAVQGALGHLYAFTGKSKEARAMLHRLQEHSGAPFTAPHTMAVIYAGLGDKDLAFQWLDASFEHRIELVAWVKVDPRFAVLRNDPRFGQFLARIGLGESEPSKS